MSLLDDYDALLFDLDGTIYRGEEPVPGADRAVEAAHAAGTKVRFVTNNASRGPDEVARHLVEMGIRAETAEVSTSAQAAAAVLAEKLQPGTTVLVVGSDALVHEVELKNLTTTRKHGDAVQAVVQGLSKDTSWWDLAEACQSIRARALWVACNVDPTLPTERGPLPGNGSLVAALRAATGTEPLIAGKPATPLMDEAQRSADAEKPLVIGDRLDTDIAGAVGAGLDSLLVLTGVSVAQDLLDAPEDMRPTYVAHDVGAVTEAGIRLGSDKDWPDAVRDALARLGLEHEVA
ncbi:HAD-IIA family hydrolase [Actinophytocola sp.]|uniref:HAD-IIA family hydrolase n=1 Tax=Actinophytocola sp. TaxID=1872138 RepID=UPI00389A8FC5